MNISKIFANEKRLLVALTAASVSVVAGVVGFLAAPGGLNFFAGVVGLGALVAAAIACSPMGRPLIRRMLRRRADCAPVRDI
jgi:hypothetical protein